MAFVLNPGIRKIQNCEVCMNQTQRPLDGKVKCEIRGLSRSYRRGHCMFSCVLCCKGTLSVGNGGQSHFFLIDNDYAGDLQDFINVVEDCGFLEMKRAPELASDHHYLWDLTACVNWLLLVSIQIKVALQLY